MDQGERIATEVSGAWSVKRPADEDSLEAWRWRSYTDHLVDLGYDLSGGASDERYDDSVAAYRRRGGRG